MGKRKKVRIKWKYSGAGRVGHMIGRGIRDGIETKLRYGYACGKNTGSDISPLKRKRSKP